MAGPEHGAHAAGASETHHLVAVAHGALHVFECGGRHAGENVAALAGDRIVADNRDAMADSPSPCLSVRVLGPARVTVDGAAAPPELLWRKHLALLVYLARSPRKSRTREHLIGLLWSDRDERQARHSLSEALRVLRRALGDERLVADVDQVRLAPDAVTVDCDRFAELCECR